MAIVQFDHAVVLVDDDTRSQEFYTEFLGASHPHGPAPTEINGRIYHHTFMKLEDRGQSIGLFETPRAVPTPKAERELTCVVYRVSTERYEKAKSALTGIELMGPALGDAPTFYTHDSEGNPIGFVANGSGTPTMLDRLELDVPHLESAIRFYESIFGLGSPEVGVLPRDWGRNDYARFPVGDYGQALVIIESPDAPAANVAQHLAFLITRKHHLALKENLKQQGVEEVVGRPGGEEVRLEGEIGTYLMDPGGRKLQWITNASTED